MSIQRNIRLQYAIAGLSNSRFFIPVIALFYIASQVSLAEFAFIFGVFFLVTLLLEIPSGAVTDLLGKKRTIILTRFLYIVEIFILAFYDGFLPFLIAKIISGVAVSFTSGTFSSMLYDTLKRMGKEGEHKKYAGKQEVIKNVSMAFAFILGGFLFAIDPKLPAVAYLPFVVMAFLLSLFMEEPYPSKRKLGFRNSYIQLKEGLQYFWRKPELRFISFYSLPLAAATTIGLSLSSAYFEQVLVPVALIGIIAFFSSLAVAYSARKADAFERRLGLRKSLDLTLAFAVLGTFLMALMAPYLGVLFYFLIPLSLGLFNVISRDFANRHAPSTHRTTLLSIVNMFGSFGVFLLFPLIGAVSEAYSMGAGFTLFGGILLAYGLALLAYQRLRMR